MFIPDQGEESAPILLGCPRCAWQSERFDTMAGFYAVSLDYKDHFKAEHSEAVRGKECPAIPQ